MTKFTLYDFISCVLLLTIAASYAGDRESLMFILHLLTNVMLEIDCSSAF